MWVGEGLMNQLLGRGGSKEMRIKRGGGGRG
jgi:hypothetical protein